MADFPHDCPHCGSKKIGFTVEGHCNILNGCAWFAVCNNKKCTMPVVAVTSHPMRPPDLDTITAFYPAPQKADIPGHIPENAGRFYEQAENSLPQNPDAAGAMYRKVLDVGLKLEFPDAPDNLATRIKTLVKDGVLTKTLGDFAHHVRLGGNNAIHDAVPFTVKDAEELRFFTKMVMTYVFTLPEMIRLRKLPPDVTEEK